MRDRIVPAGVICVVDAESGGDAIARRDEAREQVESADRVLLAKLDVATPEAVRRCHALLDAHAAPAERASFPRDDAGALAMTAWVVEKRALRHHVDSAAPHHHGNQLVAVTFVDDAPLLGDRVLAVLDTLGDRLVRAKGFVRLVGDRRGFVERAGIRTALTDVGAWHSGRSELVLIGDGLDEPTVQRALWACRAGG